MRVPTGTSPSEASLMPLITGHMASRVIFVAAELNLADLIAEGCQTIAELANRTRTHAPSLERVLRTLGSLGVMDETEPGKFVLTPPVADRCLWFCAQPRTHVRQRAVMAILG